MDDFQKLLASMIVVGVEAEKPSIDAQTYRLHVATTCLIALGLLPQHVADSVLSDYQHAEKIPKRKGENLAAIHLASGLLLGSTPGYKISAMLAASIEDGGLDTRILASTLDHDLPNAKDLLAQMMAGATVQIMQQLGMVPTIDNLEEFIATIKGGDMGVKH